MKIFVCIDDSRRLDGGGAGVSVSLLAEDIEKNNWGKSNMASRHRLYPHPETAYKKHNTARSFAADIEGEYLQKFISRACNIIKSSDTPDSNTGLAVVVPEYMQNPEELVDYAYRVKQEFVSMEEADQMSKKAGIYLVKLNGTGNGIIGALGGAGLRMTGNDGQFRGKLQIGSGEGYAATAQEIIANSYVEQVRNMDFESVGDDEYIRMGEKVKVVLLDYKYTLMVFPTEIDHPKWQTSTTNMLRVF